MIGILRLNVTVQDNSTSVTYLANVTSNNFQIMCKYQSNLSRILCPFRLMLLDAVNTTFGEYIGNEYVLNLHSSVYNQCPNRPLMRNVLKCRTGPIGNFTRILVVGLNCLLVV